VSIVVSDTSPVRALIHLNLFSLVEHYFSDIVIPPAVVAELERPITKFVPIAVSSLGKVRVTPPSDLNLIQLLLRELDQGESEAIALAVELHADALLIDESKGRAVAERMGIERIGALGLLARAKRDRLIPKIKPLLDELRDGLGFYVSDSFYAAFIRSAGE